MATQFDPIAKDESLNTTESPSRNVADVLAQGLDAIEQAIAGGSSSGGHTIVNASGTDMTQRAKMQFVDAVVTDDAVNDVTKISTTPASYPSSNVTYRSGSVEDAINEIEAKVDTNAIHYEDVEVRCSDVTWTASTFGKYYYLAKPAVQISGTVIATSIVGWSSLRTSDNIQAIYDADGAMLLSDTNSFASPNTRVTVRIVTVGA